MWGMKKYVFAGLLAACVLFIAAAQERKRPEPVTVTGTVRVSDSAAVIVTADGKEYTLVTMGEPPSGGKRPSGGNPPAGNPPDGTPPQTVTQEELSMLDGKLVSVTGFIPPAADADRKDAPKPPAESPAHPSPQKLLPP